VNVQEPENHRGHRGSQRKTEVEEQKFLAEKGFLGALWVSAVKGFRSFGLCSICNSELNFELKAV
jgi:hypothetical protein